MATDTHLADPRPGLGAVEATASPSAGPVLPQGVRLNARGLLSHYRRIVVGADALVGLIAGLAGLVLRFGREAGPAYLLLSALVPVAWVGAIAVQRGYQDRYLGTGPEEYRRLGDATLVLFAVAAIGSFVSKGDLSRGYLLIVLPTALTLGYLTRRLLRRWLFRRRLDGHGLQRVLVVGRDDAVGHVVEQFRREPWHGLVPVVAGIDLTAGTRTGTGTGAATGAVAVLEAVDALDVDAVAVAADPDLAGHTLRRLGWALAERDVDLLVSPGIVEVAGPRLSIRPVAGLSLLHLESPPVTGGRVLAKAVADRVVAAALLVLALPVLLAVALAVRLGSPGPVIFRQQRVGVGGRPFSMLKFRSMVADAEARRPLLEVRHDGDGPLFKLRQDPRVTPVGRVLRRYSLDELPQLWNVLRGEMSLVGPRPPLPQEVARYDGDAVRRLLVRPGLTGLWQVSGRSDLTWEESLRLDLRYVDNWSYRLDLAVLWRTARAVLRRHGAY